MPRRSHQNLTRRYVPRHSSSCSWSSSWSPLDGWASCGSWHRATGGL